MAKYKKKPVIVEAEQFLPEKWTLEQFKKYGIETDPYGYTGWKMKTLENQKTKHEVTEGDYIVTGTKGEFYPVKKEIFPDIYEKVEDE